MKQTSGKIRILTIMGMVILLIMSLFGCAKKVEIGEIESFSFGYTAGYMMNSNVRYSLLLENGTYTATVKPLNEPQEAAQTFTVDEHFVQSLRQLLIDNEAGKWNGFNKSDKNVLDGDNFTMFILMTDGTTLDAHGYMKWPKNYHAVKNGLDELFGGLTQ